MTKKKKKNQNNNNGFRFKVIRQYFSQNSGYFIAEVSKIGRLKINVNVSNKKILVGLNRPPTIPISKIRLLLKDYDLSREEKRKLKENIEYHVYNLINKPHELENIILRRDWYGAKIYVYKDHTVRIFTKDKRYGDACSTPFDLHDTEELKNVLVGIAFEHDKKLNINQVLPELEKFFKDVNELVRPYIEVQLGSRTIKYADGIKARLTLLKGNSCYFIIWVYGETTIGNTTTIGATSVFLKSEGGKVEIVESIPAFISTDIIAFPLELIKNCVLLVDEFNELYEEIKKINEGRVKPPSWREVFEEIVKTAPRFYGATEEDYYIDACFIKHTYFYDLFSHTVYSGIAGESGSGKRNRREFIGASTRSVKVTDPSEASLARIINTFYPVAIIDETKMTETLRKFLNAGSQKGALITRCDKENPNKIIVLDPYSPKVWVCQPQEMSIFPQDTRNRSIIVTMVRQKGNFEREMSREEAWKIKKKLYLLMLYRWPEYLQTYKELDPIISKVFGGHDRDKWLHILTVAKLVGEDVFKKLFEFAKKQYRKEEKVSEKVQYVINGILRAMEVYTNNATGEGLREGDFGKEAELIEEVAYEEVEREGEKVKVFKATPKALILANEGEYDSKTHRGLATSLGLLLKKGELPFVIGFDREGKKGKRCFHIDVKKLEEYIESYEVELPEDVDYDVVNQFYGMDIRPVKLELESISSSGAEKVSDMSEVSAKTNFVETQEKQVDKCKIESVQETDKGPMTATELSIADTSDTSDTLLPQGEKQKILVEFLNACREIAKVDGHLHKIELEYLVKKFGLTKEDIDSLVKEGRIVLDGDRVIVNA